MKGIQITKRLSAAFLTGVALVALSTGTAHARNYSVAASGSNLTWTSGTSVLPVKGNLPTGYPYYGNPTKQWLPQQPNNVIQTGSGPASLTLPPSLWKQDGYYFQQVVPSRPFNIFQFTTELGVTAPAGGSAMFSPGSKTSRPANFAYCPGQTATGPCTTYLPGGGQGTVPGIVQYTAATPQFGGTMQIFTKGQFTWWVIGATSPTEITWYNVDANDSVPAPLPVGAGYASTGVNTAATPFPRYVNPVFTAPYGFALSSPGTPITPPLQGGTSTVVGFPFTVGQVYIKVPWSPTPYNPLSYLIVSDTGTDSRTPLGSGMITMVAGGLTYSTAASIPTLVTMQINLPEPGRVLMLGAGAGLLGLLAIVRRRTSARVS